MICQADKTLYLGTQFESWLHCQRIIAGTADWLKLQQNFQKNVKKKYVVWITVMLIYYSINTTASTEACKPGEKQLEGTCVNSCLANYEQWLIRDEQGDSSTRVLFPTPVPLNPYVVSGIKTQWFTR